MLAMMVRQQARRLGCSAVAGGGFRERGDYIVTRGELEQLIEQLQSGRLGDEPDFSLIDVREPHECAQGMIPTAENIPLGQIPAHFPPRACAVHGHPKDDEHDLIVYCRSGARSQQAVDYLRSNGYRAYNYKGSSLEWFGR